MALGLLAGMLYLSYLAAPMAPVLGWKLNQEWIAQNQCKNRWNDRPCGGKCVLMQRLKAQEERQNPAAPMPTVNTELVSAHMLQDGPCRSNYPKEALLARHPAPSREALPRTAWITRLLRPPRLG